MAIKYKTLRKFSSRKHNWIVEKGAVEVGRTENRTTEPHSTMVGFPAHNKDGDRVENVCWDLEDLAAYPKVFGPLEKLGL